MKISQEKVETIQELQKFKEQLIQEIDQKFESMIQKLRDEQIQ